jgi:hypothetical protein
MTESKNNVDIETFINDFMEKIKQTGIDDNSKSILISIFKQSNSDIHLIDKKCFVFFLSSMNYDKIITILDSINNGNKNIDEYPNDNYVEKINKKENMKKIVTNYHNYTFINKDLLCNNCRVSEKISENNIIKLYQNNNNDYLTKLLNNYIASKKEYKNLYYVEELTKKIFILLYFHEKKIEDKINNNIKDIYNFKKY